MRKDGITVAVIITLLLTVFSASVYSQEPPQLPGDLYIPKEVGVQIPPPSLELAGGPLVLSNSPESVSGVFSAAALYRTRITSDHFRVFLHHVNTDSRVLRIGVAVTNPGTSKRQMQVFLSRNSQMLPSKNECTVFADSAYAGNVALRNWFRCQPVDQYIKTIAPGKTHFIMQDVPGGSTVTGMYDFGIRAVGNGLEPPEAVVTVMVCAELPADPTVIEVLQPDRSTPGWYRRGTFAHSDRIGRIECDASQVSRLDLAGPHQGKWARPMPNEVEKAIEDPYGMNPGNYGVVYHLSISMRNTTDNSLRTRCLLSAAGGLSYSGVAVDQTYAECGKFLGVYQSWVFKDVTIPSQQIASSKLDFTLPGGSNGAHRLYIWPGESAEPTVSEIDIQL